MVLMVTLSVRISPKATHYCVLKDGNLVRGTGTTNKELAELYYKAVKDGTFKNSVDGPLQSLLY
jgi:hypothetical protein